MSHAHAVSGLISRGGLSNWVFLFRPDELVLVDVGMTPTIVAGLEAGVRGKVTTKGPVNDLPGVTDEAWVSALAAKAKSVETVPYTAIRELRVHRVLSANELHLVTDTSRTFGIMERRATERIAQLAAHFVPAAFRETKGGLYAWIEQRAEFLVR